MSLSVPDRDDWFEDDESFPRPRWGAVNGWMRVFAGSAELDEAWRQFTRIWLGRLRSALGGQYVAMESEHFHFLTEQPEASRTKTLAFLERIRSHIHGVLGEKISTDAPGKHLVLRFSELDDYYAYIAHFYPDGHFAGSSGVFLNDGYLHIAYAESWSPDQDRRILVHELTHDLLAYLPLPPWLNESLAMAFEADLAGGLPDPLSQVDARRHREYWSRETIQQFWLGYSFSDVEGQELAYSLARILLDLIHRDIRPSPEDFRRFVIASDFGDAGAIAARDHLHVELQDLVACFLGPGEWAPRPKEWKRREASLAPSGPEESGALDLGEEPPPEDWR